MSESACLPLEKSGDLTVFRHIKVKNSFTGIGRQIEIPDFYFIDFHDDTLIIVDEYCFYRIYNRFLKTASVFLRITSSERGKKVKARSVPASYQTRPVMQSMLYNRLGVIAASGRRQEKCEVAKLRLAVKM